MEVPGDLEPDTETGTEQTISRLVDKVDPGWFDDLLHRPYLETGPETAVGKDKMT
jgi:hypothetical protein